MYITCHKCKTSFVVSTEQIGTNGRKVKCSKCDHIWYQEPLQLSTPKLEINEDNQNIDYSLYAHKGFYDHEYNLPALLPKKSSSKYNLISTVLISLIIILAILLYKGDLQPSSLETAVGLNINNVQIKNQEEANKITVSYYITNNSNYEMKIPLARIRLLDSNNHSVKTYINNKRLGTIKSGESIYFEQEFTASTDIIKNIDIMLGNKIDLMLK